MKIRTAILGYGRSGSTMHAGPVEKNPAFEMAAVCDIDPARREQAAARFRCPVYADYHAMLREARPDLVCVITRSDQHAAMACDCLAAGANVLVTKPWAVNAGEAQRMIAAARAAGRILLPWLPARWGCELRRLRQLLAEQAIGRVFLIRRAVTSFGTRCDWQTERRFGGGYVLNWGPHIVDPPLLLAGSPVRSAFGRLKQVINPGDAEDMFLAVLTLADGTLVQAEYAVATDDLPGWFVQGDRGTISIRGRTLRLVQHAPARPTDPTQFGTMKADARSVREEELAGSPYGDEFEVYAEVADALAGRAPFPVKPEHALELSRVLDAIRLSSEADRTVTIERA